MKQFICSFFCLLLVATGFSQKVYFIYLQTEPEQAFYVKLRDNVFNSGSSGFVILSRLRDSSYSFSIGFPQNKWPEHQFKVDMKAKDHGYLLKNFGDKGWGLFDLQTLAVQMGTTEEKAMKAELKEVSLFTEVLSRAANDPSLREKPIKREEQVKTEPVFAKNVEPKDPAVIVAANGTGTTTAKQDTPVIKETATVKKEDTPQPTTTTTTKKDDPSVITETVKDPPAGKATATIAVKKDEPVVTKETVADKKIDTPMVKESKAEISDSQKPVFAEYKPSVVKRKSESSTSEGFGLIFVDEYADGKKDTIRIMIPNPRTRMVVKEQPMEQPKEPVKEQAREEKKFLDITADTKDVSDESKPVTQKADTKKAAAAKTKECAPATDADFLKLRKRMAGESDDDDMVSEAVKYFKTKCFTVQQVRNLSTLFLDDAGKYKFFDAAYTHVTDPADFTSLQTELKDEYYINRFKAMLR